MMDAIHLILENAHVEPLTFNEQSLNACMRISDIQAANIASQPTKE